MAFLLSKGLLTRTVLVSGKLKTCGTVVDCMFVAPGRFTENISQRLFSEPPTILTERRVFTPFLRFFIKASSHRYDICIANLPKEYSFLIHSVATYVGQSVVSQKIDTRGGWEQVRRNLSRRHRTRVNNFEAKFGLNCTISERLEDLTTFYHEMFVPYTIARFGNLAVIDSYEQIKGLFKGGFLMLITRNGERIAGVLCRADKHKLTYFRAGVINGDEEILDCGAMVAAYYYMVDYAVKNGLQELDALGSKPFLNDGVYRYKASWGAVAGVFDHRHTQPIHYICGTRSKQLARIFHTCPTIVIKDGSLQMILGHPGEDPPTGADVSTMIESFYISGIRSAEVIASDGSIIRIQLTN